MAMTEQEWLGGNNPTQMLEFLRDKASHRKLQLFCCACCRRIWSLLTDERSRKGVIVREQYEDGQATEEELSAAGKEASLVASSWAASAARDTASGNHYRVAWFATNAAASSTDLELSLAGEFGILLLHDIFGNPFHLSFHPAWRTAKVTALAQDIYDDRAFYGLPILADALEDAGCDNSDILNHCRQPGEHVRGCWVVDLILGKE
jgi:hypothetical protein